MSDKDIEIKDEIEEPQFIESLGETQTEKNRTFEFFTDFLTGFGALFILGIILFIVVPLFLVLLKVGVSFAVPVAVFGFCIILIALFGRFIKFLIKKW
jgi:hypothetical protein